MRYSPNLVLRKFSKNEWWFTIGDFLYGEESHYYSSNLFIALVKGFINWRPRV